MILTRLAMNPAHRNYADAQPCTLLKIKQLDVEGEAIDASGFENGTADVDTKCFETTLRIPKRQVGGEAHQQIKNTTRLFTPPRLMLADQATVQRTRAKRNVDLAVGNRFDHLRRLLQGRRKIGIEEKSDRLLRRQQSQTHCGAFAAIWKILEETRFNLCRF